MNRIFYNEITMKDLKVYSLIKF